MCLLVAEIVKGAVCTFVEASSEAMFHITVSVTVSDERSETDICGKEGLRALVALL